MKKTQTIFLLFFLIVAACSNPIDQAKQNELIEYNQIRIGMKQFGLALSKLIKLFFC